MKTDKELIMVAAKAAGLRYADARLIPASRPVHGYFPGNLTDDWRDFIHWNPLTDDGDALRLAAALKIDIEWQVTQIGAAPTVEAYQSDVDGPSFCASENECDYRRAIVRAAAAIGEQM